jgi:Holliday junction resolvase RusA-like endonuclease
MKFIVLGNPIPKQSYRAKAGGGYQPKRLTEWQENIGWVAKEAMGIRPPIKSDAEVWIAFYRKDNRRVDLDNLSKAVLDACNGIIWEDDRQVTQLHLSKYKDKDNPRVEITIWRIDYESKKL